jgi:type I restriction enzyme S subunit
MNTAWEDVSLKEIAKPVSRLVQVIPGQSYRTIGVKWWGEGAYERETIDGARTVAKRLSLVHKDDLIINKIWVRHGSIAIASSAVDGCAASGEFPTFELNLHRVLPQWIHWLTKTRSFWAKCDVLSRGSSGKNRIKPDLFLTIRVPLPAILEQERLVMRIEKLASRVNEAQSLRQEDEVEIRRMLLAAFWRVAKDAPRQRMGEVAPLVRRPVSVDGIGSYPELGIRSFGKGTFHKPVLSGIEVGDKRIFRIEPGDLLFSNVFAWEGAIAVAKTADAGRYGSHRYITCVPKPDVATSRFLWFYFLTQEGLEQIRSASPGGAGRNRTLGLAALEHIQVPIPTMAEQEWFDAIQLQVDVLKGSQAETAAELDALLPAVLSKAFAGEL